MRLCWPGPTRFRSPGTIVAWVASGSWPTSSRTWPDRGVHCATWLVGLRDSPLLYGRPSGPVRFLINQLGVQVYNRRVGSSICLKKCSSSRRTRSSCRAARRSASTTGRWSLSEQGVPIDLLTYHPGQDVDIPGVRIVRIPRIRLLEPVPIGPSWKKLFLDVFMILWTIGLLARHRYRWCTPTRRRCSGAGSSSPCSASG